MKRIRIGDFRQLEASRQPVVDEILAHLRRSPVSAGQLRLADSVDDLWKVQDIIVNELLQVEHLEKHGSAAADTLAWKSVLRKFADYMAWEMIGKDAIWIARRLYKGEALGRLTESNFQSCLLAARKITDGRENAFALLADITTFVQLGDLLVRDDNGLTFVEVKEGDLNADLLHILHNCPDLEIAREAVSATWGNKAGKQLDRMNRQQERMTNTVDLLTTGLGVDQTGQHVRISQETYIVCTYRDELFEGLSRARQRGWAIGVVDDCLYWGVYRDIEWGPSAFHAWIDGLGFQGIVTDYLQSMTVPLVPPPLSQEVVAPFFNELISGSLKIRLALDLEKFIELGASSGAQTRWMSKKETARLRQHGGDPFIWKGRAIAAVNSEGNTVAVGDGVLARVLFDFTEPHCTLRLVNPEAFAEHIKREKGDGALGALDVHPGDVESMR